MFNLCLVGMHAGMKIISYLDNDEMHKPDTVFMLETQRYTSKEQLITQHPKVFCQGVGKLEGEYHIRLNKHAIPVQHSPRRVPVALRDRLKDKLDSLVTQGIIMPVT